MNRILGRAAGALALALGTALTALPAAAGYTSLTVFGDSLSDTGNLRAATGGALPPAPLYFSGRYSDGPVWVEYLAAGLGLGAGAVPALQGGGNYAFAGARTGTGSQPPGLLAQYGGLWAPAHPAGADPNGLYVVVGGGNDMRDARSSFTGSTAADVAGRQTAAATAAQNVFSLVAALASGGARNVLIATLPDLGATPEAIGLGLAAASSDATARYNALLPGIEAMAEGMFADLDVITFDFAALAAAVRADATTNGGARYGITNVLTPCGAFPGSVGIACGVSAFSDDLHPSAALHAIIGAAALDALAVPEPGSLALAAAALVLLAGVRRRRTHDRGRGG